MIVDEQAPPETPAARAAFLARWTRALVTGAVVSLGSTAAGALAAAITTETSPVSAVAKRVIDGMPKGPREWAIRTFATDDKLVLGIGIVVILTIVATVVAKAAPKRRWLIEVAVAVFSLIGIGAQNNPGPATIITAGATALAAELAFVILVPFVDGAAPRLVPITVPTSTKPPADGAPRAQTAEPAARAEPMIIHRWEAPVDRRQFVARAGALWVGTATMAGVAAAIDRSDNSSVTAARAKLPKIRAGSPDAAPAVPRGVTVDSGVAPYVTASGDFYRIDTAYIAPRVTLGDWKLSIGGYVDKPLTLTYDELLDRHVVERYITLCCVSNEVGGDLVSNARFIGVPLAELLAEAGVQSRGEQIAMTSVDGWTCGFPTDIALDGRDAMVAIGMNGEPLPVEHGFPARIVVPGLYGYVSATKWLQTIDLVGWDEFDGYWIPRGWSKLGPVKTQSRIDVPRSGSSVKAGKVAVAGIAFAQHRGISRVEVRVDDGDWSEARLGDTVSSDTWRQWIYEWDAKHGDHTLSVRATDGKGATQTARESTPDPDGATGHHTIDVRVD